MRIMTDLTPTGSPEEPAPNAIYRIQVANRPLVTHVSGTADQIVSILRQAWNERHANATPANATVTLPRYEEGDELAFMNDIIFATMYDTGIVPRWRGQRHTTHERFLRYLHDVGKIDFAGPPPAALGALAMTEEMRLQNRESLRSNIRALEPGIAMPSETWL